MTRKQHIEQLKQMNEANVWNDKHLLSVKYAIEQLSQDDNKEKELNLLLCGNIFLSITLAMLVILIIILI